MTPTRALVAGLAVASALANVGTSGRGRFEEVSASAGLAYEHVPPDFDRRLAHINPLWATFLAGAAVGDVDADGDDDILFVSARGDRRSALYRNDGGFRFTDVTTGSGLDSLNTEATAAAGARWVDYDNDARLDLYVYGFGLSRMLRQSAEGRFEDVTAKVGLAQHDHNTTAAIVFDYDRDGYVDVLVGAFFADGVNLFALESTRILPNHGRTANNGGTKRLYRNVRGERFVERGAAAGFTDTGFTTAIGHGDYDNDGWPDVYVANDFGPDYLYRNRGDGTFEDVSRRAIGPDGRKGMNVEFGDYNNDGRLDIYVTNITEPWLAECNMLWLGWPTDTFIDVSLESRTCDTGWGWGAKFLDYDNDGRLDLFVANGFISAGPEDYNPIVQEWQRELTKADRMRDVIDAAIWPAIGNRSFCGYERNHLFRNIGEFQFAEVGPRLGVDSPRDSRGVAIADFDGDGAVDLLVTNASGRPLLYRNEAGTRGNWLALALTGTESNRDAIGARVTLRTRDGAQIREVNGGNGYAAQSSRQVHFGLGSRRAADTIEIRWPSGTVQRLEGVRGNQTLRITEAPPAASR